MQMCGLSTMWFGKDNVLHFCFLREGSKLHNVVISFFSLFPFRLELLPMAQQQQPRLLVLEFNANQRRQLRRAKFNMREQHRQIIDMMNTQFEPGEDRTCMAVKVGVDLGQIPASVAATLVNTKFILSQAEILSVPSLVAVLIRNEIANFRIKDNIFKRWELLPEEEAFLVNRTAENPVDYVFDADDAVLDQKICERYFRIQNFTKSGAGAFIQSYCDHLKQYFSILLEAENEKAANAKGDKTPLHYHSMVEKLGSYALSAAVEIIEKDLLVEEPRVFFHRLTTLEQWNTLNVHMVTELSKKLVGMSDADATNMQKAMNAANARSLGGVVGTFAMNAVKRSRPTSD